METNVNYTIVGAFVISLIAAIAVTIIWLSSGFSSARYNIYHVKMQESVSGLNAESAVEYNGVSVGSVNKITLNPDNPRLVDLLLSINAETPITQGTRAVLTTRGITGLTFIALTDKGNDMQPLVAKPGQRYPIIPTSPSIFLRLDTALTQLNKSFQSISASVQSLLTAGNLKSITETLAHMDQFTKTIAGNGERMNSIFTNTENASKRLTTLIQSGNDMTQALSDMVKEVKQNPSLLIRGPAPTPLGPGEVK